MRAVIQRVLSGRVLIEGREVGKCGQGYVLLVGVHRDDTETDARKMAEKIRNLRLFNDADGKINLSLADVPGASVLAVSNFTVYGDAVKNRRPSFTASAGYADGLRIFDSFVHGLRELGVAVETGVFGADMQIELVNDGPVTLVLDYPA